MSNSIFVITPYKHRGMWVFTDRSRGLVREPFVAGADTVIDMAVMAAGIKAAGRGFNLIFSETRFPSNQIELSLKKSDIKSAMGGNTYHCRQMGIDAWLCPALYKYFIKAPKKIFAEFRPIDRPG